MDTDWYKIGHRTENSSLFGCIYKLSSTVIINFKLIGARNDLMPLVGMTMRGAAFFLFRGLVSSKFEEISGMTW